METHCNFELQHVAVTNFFTKADANVTSDSKSEQDEEEEFNDSDHITLENISSLQLKLA